MLHVLNRNITKKNEIYASSIVINALLGHVQLCSHSEFWPQVLKKQVKSRNFQLVYEYNYVPLIVLSKMKNTLHFPISIINVIDNNLLKVKCSIRKMQLYSCVLALISFVIDANLFDVVIIAHNL